MVGRISESEPVREVDRGSVGCPEFAHCKAVAAPFITLN